MNQEERERDPSRSKLEAWNISSSEFPANTAQPGDSPGTAASPDCSTHTSQWDAEPKASRAANMLAQNVLKWVWFFCLWFLFRFFGGVRALFNLRDITLFKTLFFQKIKKVRFRFVHIKSFCHKFFLQDLMTIPQPLQYAYTFHFC